MEDIWGEKGKKSVVMMTGEGIIHNWENLFYSFAFYLEIPWEIMVGHKEQSIAGVALKLVLTP